MINGKSATIDLVDYYFVKIGPGNSLAVPLLEEKRLGHPMVAGFFRAVRLPEVQDHPADQRPRFSYQLLDLYRWSRGEISGHGVVLAQGTLWILEPAGEMQEMERDLFESTVGPTPHKDDIPKLVPVRVSHRERITHIPTLLSQINADRSLSSSTFKLIADDFGNNIALDHVLFKSGLLHSYPHITRETKDLPHLLDCLGGNELIVLVAKLLEEQGLHVPAPSGGFVKNIDIFAYNDRCHALDLNGLVVPPRSAFRSGAVTIQVRGQAQDRNPAVSPEIDYLIQLNATPAGDDRPGGRILNRDWIETMLRRSPATRLWLGRVLRWIPFAGSVIRRLGQESADLQQPR